MLLYLDFPLPSLSSPSLASRFPWDHSFSGLLRFCSLRLLPQYKSLSELFSAYSAIIFTHSVVSAITLYYLQTGILSKGPGHRVSFKTELIVSLPKSSILSVYSSAHTYILVSCSASASSPPLCPVLRDDATSSPVIQTTEVQEST